MTLKFLRLVVGHGNAPCLVTLLAVVVTIATLDTFTVKELRHFLILLQLVGMDDRLDSLHPFSTRIDRIRGIRQASLLTIAIRFPRILDQIPLQRSRMPWEEIELDPLLFQPWRRSIPIMEEILSHLLRLLMGHLGLLESLLLMLRLEETGGEPQPCHRTLHL
jgi:hypothetical protein